MLLDGRFASPFSSSFLFFVGFHEDCGTRLYSSFTLPCCLLVTEQNSFPGERPPHEQPPRNLLARRRWHPDSAGKKANPPPPQPPKPEPPTPPTEPTPQPAAVQMFYLPTPLAPVPWAWQPAPWLRAPVGINGLCTAPVPAPPPAAAEALVPPPPAETREEKKVAKEKKAKKFNANAPPSLAKGVNYMYPLEHTILHIFRKAAPVWEERYRGRKL